MISPGWEWFGRNSVTGNGEDFVYKEMVTFEMCVSNNNLWPKPCIQLSNKSLNST